MISLIKNELTKIFHKKGIYITLIITLVFIAAINIIYKFKSDSFDYDVSYDIENYEEDLKNLDPNNPREVDAYVQAKSGLEASKLIQKYGDKYNWQMRVVNNYVRSTIISMNTYLYESKDTKKYEEAKKEYEMQVAKIDSGDWKYFVETELKGVEQDLEDAKKQKEFSQNETYLDDEIYNLELEKQVLKWRLEKNICYGDDYKNNCLDTWYMRKKDIKGLKQENFSNEHNYKLNYQRMQEEIAISEYDIVNETNSGIDSDARGLLLNIFDQYQLFIIIMGVMIAGSIVSEEFSKGTIKLLLIKPYQRAKILLAKFITSIIVLLIVILLVMLMQFILGGIVQGFNLFKVPAVVYNHNINQIQEINIPTYLAMQLVGKLPMYVLLMTLAFAVSTLFTNSALAITIGLLGYMGGPIVNQLAMAYKLSWIRYFVTPNWDLTQYFYGGLPEFSNVNLALSIAVIVVYMLIMLIPTFIVFNKRNIKNI